MVLQTGSDDRQLTIGLLVHPMMVAMDLVGPLTVMNLIPGVQTHRVWKSNEKVATELGIGIEPTTSFAQCPCDLDVLFVPGGLSGTVALMDDREVIDFLADRGSRARFVTSVCTGSLLLGAAGLLIGYRATSHWYVRDQLKLFGATPSGERVVEDRNRITGGGVTAGIDFGLMLAARLSGRQLAERIQLMIEYAPSPPFGAGTPEASPGPIRDEVLLARRALIRSARETSERVGARMRPER